MASQGTAPDMGFEAPDDVLALLPPVNTGDHLHSSPDSDPLIVLEPIVGHDIPSFYLFSYTFHFHFKKNKKLFPPLEHTMKGRQKEKNIPWMSSRFKTFVYQRIQPTE